MLQFTVDMKIYPVGSDPWAN